MKDNKEKIDSNELKKNLIFGFIQDSFEKVVNKVESFKHEPISLDDLVSRLSDDTDKEILKIQKTDKITFIGGELIVFFDIKKDNLFSLDLKLYFQGKNEEVILKEKHKELELSILTNESKLDLMKKLEVTYEVNEPNK